MFSYDYNDDNDKILKAYFEDIGLVKHQIGSYNHFIDNLFPTITKQYNPISIRFQEKKKKQNKQTDEKDGKNEKDEHDERDEQDEQINKLLAETTEENIGTKIDHKKFTYNVFINFDNPILGEAVFRENNGTKKKMSPHIARMRNFTYTCPMYVDVIITTVIKRKDDLNGKPVHKHTHCINKVEFGSMPIMLKSKCCILSKKDYFDKNECPNDPGGYFIISGKEKVLISQDECIVNMPMVNKKNGKFKEQGELVSISKDKFGIVRKFDIKITSESSQKRSTIKAVIPHIKHEVPICILFRALGIENDCDIVSHIIMDIDVKEHTNILCLMNDSLNEAYTCLEKKNNALYKQIIDTYNELKNK